VPETIIIPFLTGLGLSKTAAVIVANLLVSTALNLVAGALNRPKGQDQSRDLTVPRSLPAYRYAYGKRVRVAGSWAPGWVVSNGIFYGCIILNSRPSAGTNLKIFIDKREVPIAGSVQDFGNVQQGVVTVDEGETQAIVTHGLGATPTAAQVGASYGDLVAAVDLRTSTTFRVTIDTPAPEGGTVVKWAAARPGGGATASSSPFLGFASFWLGLGAQGHPPANILLEHGDLAGLDTQRFWASDKWSGRTVLWVRFRKGPSNTVAGRWPSAPPEVELEMDWSRVWDPRNEAQDPDDPDTWAVEDNQALCLLDALRMNPLAAFRGDSIWRETFEHAADVADEDVPVKAGGTEPRYRVGGLLVFNGQSELLAQIAPLSQAGGGSLIKVGGRVGYRAGEYQAPVVTLTDYLRDQPIRFQRTRRQRELPNAIKAIFPDPDSQWESSELIPHPIRSDWDGGDDRIDVLDLPLVPYARQAMRLQKIEGERLKRGKTLSAKFPPEAIEVVAASTLLVALPGADRRNGEYVATQVRPAEWLDGDEGVAMAIPLDAVEEAEEIYAWDPSEEQDRIAQAFAPIDLSVPLPFDLVGGFDFDGFGNDRLSVTFSVPGGFVPGGPEGEPQFVPNPLIESFEWELQGNSGEMTPAGLITNFFETGTMRREGVGPGSYIVRIRSVGGGAVSPWVYGGPYLLGVDLDAPTAVSASPGAGQITINATSPDGDHAALEYWGSDVDDPWSATLLATQTVATLTADSFTETGLDAGATRFYFVRSVASTGAVGPWSDSVTATAT
jgi:hypothetical protein